MTEPPADPGPDARRDTGAPTPTPEPETSARPAPAEDAGTARPGDPPAGDPPAGDVEGASGDRSGGGKGWRWMRRGLAVVGLLVVLLTGYGVGIEPRLVLDVREEEARLPGTPPAWVGEEVAVLADLQVGMWLDNVGMAERAVEEAVERRPAAALLLGDLVYGEGDVGAKVDQVVEIVRPLPRAGVPTYAVLGNHDYSSGAAVRLRRALERIDIRVLGNESVALAPPDDPDGERLHLVGVGAHRPGFDRPRDAVAGVPDGAARLVMMHNPASFPGLPAGSAPVAVAGHTHGGQLRLPFLPEWSFLSLVEDDPVHTDGWIDEDYGRPGNRLYVNRGIGMSLIPVRINCPPELTILTIAAADAAG